MALYRATRVNEIAKIKARDKKMKFSILDENG